MAALTPVGPQSVSLCAGLTCGEPSLTLSRATHFPVTRTPPDTTRQPHCSPHLTSAHPRPSWSCQLQRILIGVRISTDNDTAQHYSHCWRNVDQSVPGLCQQTDSRFLWRKIFSRQIFSHSTRRSNRLSVNASSQPALWLLLNLS